MPRSAYRKLCNRADEWPPKQFEASAKAAAATTTVDGTPVNGAPPHWRGHPGQVTLVFDEDDYVVQDQLFYLESTRGDV
jgi:hypothetical protein